MANGIPALVKWAGGKKQLLAQFDTYFPSKIERYFEPFVGGGAVAFFVIKNYAPRFVCLSDSNEELINAYKVVRNNVTELIEKLEQYRRSHSKEFYYKTRSLKPRELSEIERAARFVYLNKTCFNGLYRVNSKGQFNVPMGSYVNPTIYNESELRAIAQLLKKAKLQTEQFNEIEHQVKSGDFVYFDPPYYPISVTSSFTSYTKDTFSNKEQERLAQLFKKLDKKGAKVMLSNSDSDFIKGLYKGYNIDIVRASRMINCDAEGRGKINELVVTNFKNTAQKKLLVEEPQLASV